MAVYQREIMKISEKLIQKLDGYMVQDYRILNRAYRFSDLIALKVIADHGGERSIKEWSVALDQKQEAARKVIKRLEANGDLMGARSQLDSRQVLISITPRGHNVLDELSVIEESLIDIVLRDLTVNEEKAVLKFLSKLNQLTVEKYNEKK